MLIHIANQTHTMYVRNIYLHPELDISLCECFCQLCCVLVMHIIYNIIEEREQVGRHAHMDADCMNTWNMVVVIIIVLLTI